VDLHRCDARTQALKGRLSGRPVRGVPTGLSGCGRRRGNIRKRQSGAPRDQGDCAQEVRAASMVCDHSKLQEFMVRLDRPVGLFFFAARPLVRLHKQATLHELVPSDLLIAGDVNCRVDAQKS
jgi:hypothetical protein